MRSVQLKRWAATAAAVLALASVGAAAAWAAIPSQTDGKIYGCYRNSDGVLRLIDYEGGQRCKPKAETQIEWSAGGSSVGLANGSVTTEKLADEAVTTAKIQDGAVTLAQLDGLTQTLLADLADADDALQIALNNEISGRQTADVNLQDGLNTEITAREAAITFLRSDLSTAGTINTAGNPVDWTKLKNVPAGFADGLLTGAQILNGSITAADLAGSDTAGSEVIGAVTSEKIADGSIGGRDLADGSIGALHLGSGSVGIDELIAGAVTTEKMTATVVSSEAPLATSLTTTASGAPGVTGDAVSATIEPGGANHKVLIVGQVQLTCSVTCGSTPGNTVSVKWQLFEGATPVGQEYQAILSANASSTVATVAALIPDSGAAGPHTYALKVTSMSYIDGDTTVTPTSGTLTALDLGR